MTTAFTSYLEERSQRTTFRGHVSETLHVDQGLPQGSILGPLFFILFINDLPLCVKSDIDMYADDSNITSTATCVTELNATLNDDFGNISTWCKEDRMAGNSSKTKSMLITTWQKRNALPNNDRSLTVHLDGDLLENTTTERLLGVQISQNLSWDEHITSVEKTVNMKLALLRRIKCYLPLAARKLFYNTHILPHLDYCSIIWGRSTFVNRLVTLQKRAARMILDITDYQFPSAEMFKMLNWMSINERIEFRTATIVYRSINNLAPAYMSAMFKFTKDVSVRQTRSSCRNDLYIPSGKHKELYMKSFAYSGAELWNKLCPTIRSKSSLNSFKSTYIKHHFNNIVLNHI